MDITTIQEGVKEFTTPDHEFPFQAVRNVKLTNIYGKQVFLSSLYEGTNTITSSAAMMSSSGSSSSPSSPDHTKTILMFGRNLL